MKPSSDSRDNVTRVLSQDAYSDVMNIAGVKRADLFQYIRLEQIRWCGGY